MNACKIYVMVSNCFIWTIHQYCPLINFVVDFINHGLAKLLRPQDAVRALYSGLTKTTTGGFYRAWLFMRLFRWFQEMNPSTQKRYWYGFSLERLLMHIFVNPLTHTAQGYGLFTVIISMCLIGWFLDMNFLPQRAQG